MAIERDLAAPLDPRRVQSRRGGGGKSLSYLTTHDVKRTANRIFGYDGWSYVVNELVSLGEEATKPRTENSTAGCRVGYRAVVTVTIGDVRRGDVGYGDAMEYNGSRITPHELAAKEAVSDALKRCLSSWGDQFGLVLYGADPAPQADEQPGDEMVSAHRAANTATKAALDAETERAAAQRSTIDLREGPAAKLITDNQRRKLFATGKGYGLRDDDIKAVVKQIAGVDSTRLIPRYKVDAILQELEVQGLGSGA